MKYETPELTVLMPAINAIQSGKPSIGPDDSAFTEAPGAYADWE
jgi:hypothetical protein